MKLTYFEIMVLRAVATTSPDAYGVSIIDYITNNTGSEPAFSRVYSTLEKLEAQLMVGSKWVTGGPERNGKAKLVWSLTLLGKRNCK